MRLSAKPIINFSNVNDYTFGNQWIIRSGEPNALYFQVLDIDKAIQGNNQGVGLFSGISAVGTTAGLRYLLGIGTSNQPFGVQVTFPSLDGTASLTATAVQADPNDSSIWKVSLAASQKVGGGNVQFAIIEGSVTRRFSVLNMLGVEFPQSEGSC